VIIIPVTGEEKCWKCDVIPFNIGFSFATGDIIVIQNPENLHVGDIVGYALKNLKAGTFFSFALYSMDQSDTDNLVNNAISKKLYSRESIKKVIGKLVGRKEAWNDGETCWYNHSVHRPVGCHLISAIMREDLEDLNGFDERYGGGFAYSDTEFNNRVIKKGMTIKIIDDPMAIHQRHELAKYKENNKEFARNMKIFTEITRQERIYRAPYNRFYDPHRIKPVIYSDSAILECPICNDDDSVEILNLGNVPLVNNLCKTKEESLTCKKFPLAVQMFSKSRLTTLTETVNKENLFLDYVYKSGVSQPYIDHCDKMYDELNIKSLDQYACIFDIGGNDGTLLSVFKKRKPGISYVNIDASNTFIEENKNAGIVYINKFFDDSFKYKKKANWIISTNVFQHTAPIRSFVKGIYNNLAPNGAWCLEFPYLLMTVFNDNYDQVYHEHVYYFLLKNIVDLLDQEGMKVIDVSFHDIHAGTLRVISMKKEEAKIQCANVQLFLNLEKSITPEYLVEWGNRVQSKIQHFKNFIINLHHDKKVIVGFGAAAKGCVFLNSVGIDHTSIPFIIDDTPYKQNQYMPGTGILITDRSLLRRVKIDYILILAHNFSEYIINSLKSEYNGKFIIMFPEIKII
jgi:hypothetical protein